MGICEGTYFDYYFEHVDGFDELVLRTYDKNIVLIMKDYFKILATKDIVDKRTYTRLVEKFILEFNGPFE